MTDTRVLESSPVRNLTAARNQNWWNKVSGGLMPPQLPPCTASYHLLPSLLPNYFPSPTSSSSSLPPISNPNVFSWLHNNDDLPLDQLWSHSKLLLGGLMMGDEERMEMMNHHHHHHQNQHHTYQEKKTENWEEEVLRHQASIKQEISNNNGYMIISSPKSPLNKSCVTTTTIHNFNEDSNKNDNNGINFSKCNSLEISGSCFANKKPKLQVPSLRPLSQPILKVSKEKLGGRIAALHQLVSPYGKTDTASVLSEAIGYIRFLHSQVEVLSVPYFVTPSRNNIMHQQARGDMNGLFPQDPGQLVSEYCMKRSNGVSSSSTNKPNLNEETKKDLKSRGLCLVPISCTLQVGSYNGTDYWAPAFGITFQ
ncbi:transcription factor bHLH133-like [Brassica napus]|uniref:transcription factor bHLH133-like n=1 Tax=Brassica napus TaxID=3708 RepID=UPI002078E781|nr:transcription factor bHLH133-like [Brassica napus]